MLKCKVGDKVVHINPLCLKTDLYAKYCNKGYFVVEDIAEINLTKFIGVSGHYFLYKDRWKVKELCSKPKPFKLCH